MFEFRAESTASYIEQGIDAAPSGAQPQYHSIVQDLAWPTPRDDAPLPSALAQPQQQQQQQQQPLWFQEDLLAHTLQFRQMLQPAVKSTQLQVVYLCQSLILISP